MTHRRAAALLVLALTALLAEALRVSFPLLYSFAEELGFVTAAAVVPLLFAGAALTAPLGLLLGARRLLAVCAVGTVVARLVVQLQADPGLVATMATLLLGMTALALALRVASAARGPGAAAAVLAGLALDTGTRLALVTWDPAWREGVAGWTAPATLSLLVLGGLLLVGRAGDAVGPDAVRIGLLPGLVLAPATLALASPPFVASSAGVGLEAAGVACLLGLAAGAAATPAAGHRLVCGTAALVLPVTLVLLTGPSGWSGPLVLVLVPVATVCAAVLLAAALDRAAGASSPAGWRTGLGAGAGAVALVVVLMPYQLGYDLDLLRDVPAALWPGLGGAALAAAALLPAGRQARAARGPVDQPVAPREAASGRHTGRRRVGALTVTGMLLLLAVPAALALTRPAVEPAAAGPVRVMTWNIHSAVDWHGRLDPEQVARVIEDSGADVVLLQEVSRGWPIGGGLDSVSWLARRLGMTYVYGPAADHQFGNAVLADRPVLGTWAGRMERGEGPMARGYVAAEVGAGRATLRVWSTHLQHRDDTTATRQAQARVVLDAWGGAPRTVIGGDLNSRPGSPDLRPWFEGTGLVSAQDVAGDPAWDTSPAFEPDHRIDWLLATPDLRLRDAAVPPTLASDHLPVVVTVAVN